MRQWIILILAFFSTLSQVFAATEEDVDKLTTYAVIVGRAIACGIDTENEMREIGAWMDKRFPPGSNDQSTYLIVFTHAVKLSAEMQRDGKSPDSCSKVRRLYSQMPWP